MDEEPWLIEPSKTHYLNLEQWSTPLKTDHFQEKSFVSEDNFDEDQWMCWCCNDVLMSGGGVRSLENIKHVWWLVTLRDHDHRPGVNVITPLTYTNICTFLCHPEMICIESRDTMSLCHPSHDIGTGLCWLGANRSTVSKFHRPNEIVVMRYHSPESGLWRWMMVAQTSPSPHVTSLLSFREQSKMSHNMF